MVEIQRQSALEAYWQGNPWPEAELKAFKRYATFVEDFFEASAEDIEAVMEKLDEYERDHPR
jgi:hypothetical protein